MPNPEQAPLRPGDKRYGGINFNAHIAKVLEELGTVVTLVSATAGQIDPDEGLIAAANEALTSTSVPITCTVPVGSSRALLWVGGATVDGVYHIPIYGVFSDGQIIEDCYIVHVRGCQP